MAVRSTQCVAHSERSINSLLSRLRPPHVSGRSNTRPAREDQPRQVLRGKAPSQRPGQAGENSGRGKYSSRRRGSSRHPRFAVQPGSQATPGLRKGGRPWPVSDLHLPLRDHSIHLVAHRAALRWSKQPPLLRAAFPSQPRPLRGQLPTLQASGAQRPPHFRRAWMTSHVPVQRD